MTTNNFAVLDALLYACDENFILYGGYVRDSLDSTATRSKDLDVLISPKGLNKFSQLVSRMGGRKVVPHTPPQPAYASVTFSLQLGDQEISLDCSVPSSTQEWCDFTCNNLQLSSKGNLSVRCCSSTDNRSAFLLSCLQDIQAKKLVPMCPQAWLTLDCPTNRQHYVSLVSRALKMMRRGWTLEDGALKFAVAKIPASSEALVKCTICLEDIGEPLTGVVLTCDHSYHIDCLKTLMHSDGPPSYKCPLCKQEIKF